MTNRYMTPIKYTDGNGKARTGKVYFELDPIELVDWTFENPFQANMLRDNMSTLDEISKEDSRDLTQDEIRTMLGVIKLLAQISAGRPDDAGDYFIKDPNWTSSYAYKGFRMLLLTNPKETEQFLKVLLDNDVMEQFNKALGEANEKMEAAEQDKSPRTDSGETTEQKMEAKIRAKIAAENAAKQLAAAPDTE